MKSLSQFGQIGLETASKTQVVGMVSRIEFRHEFETCQWWQSLG